MKIKKLCSITFICLFEFIVVINLIMLFFNCFHCIKAIKTVKKIYNNFPNNKFNSGITKNNRPISNRNTLNNNDVYNSVNSIGQYCSSIHSCNNGLGLTCIANRCVISAYGYCLNDNDCYQNSGEFVNLKCMYYSQIKRYNTNYYNNFNNKNINKNNNNNYNRNNRKSFYKKRYNNNSNNIFNKSNNIRNNMNNYNNYNNSNNKSDKKYLYKMCIPI